MSAVWSINGVTLENLGITKAAVTFRAQAASTAAFEVGGNFDDSAIAAYGAGIILRRDSTVVFQGKVTSTPISGSGTREGQAVLCADAWEDLENTIYQEAWATGGTPSSVLLPRAVLGIGLKSGAYARLKVGEMITLIINYAISQGVAITMGTVPEGEIMIPSEVANSSCAELIRECLKLHPDWIPYLSHATTPPVFNITQAGAEGAPAATIPLTGGSVTDFSVVYRSDMRPDAVRIVYEMAGEIDGEVYRKVQVDKYPTGGPDGGPRVISATIPLAGMQMQVQKNRVQTRPLPPEGSDQDDLEAYVKDKFPQIAHIDNDDMRVAVWELEMVTETLDFPPEISPQAERMEFDDIADVTRELVRGTIEDWMRRKVGQVKVRLQVQGRPTLPQADKDLLAALPEYMTITGTNALTKTYKGITQWVAAEDFPAGLAQATYQGIIDSMSWEGSVTMADEDCSSFGYHGRIIKLTGGDEAWANMTAPVHTVDLDISTGTTRISFGPHPYLAPADFLELQRILRFRPIRWWTKEERGADQFGGENLPSAAGDTVAPFETPKTTILPQPPALQQFQVSRPFYDIGEEKWKVRVRAGQVLTIDPAGATVMGYLEAAEEDFDITAASMIYCKVDTAKDDLATAATLIAQTTAPTDTHAQPDPGGNVGVYHYRIADFTTVDGAVVVNSRYHENGPIIHRPARNNRNLKIKVWQVEENTDGICELVAGSDPYQYAYFRQGLYVGNTDPSDGATQDLLEATFVTGVS
jgi:hypothetical protein